MPITCRQAGNRLRLRLARSGSGLRSIFLVAVGCLWAGGQLQAREGYVVVARTRAIHEGHVRFVPGAIIVANSRRGVWEQIGLTNVSEVGLAPVPDEIWAGGPRGLWGPSDSRRQRASRVSLVGGSVCVGTIETVDGSNVRFAAERWNPIVTRTVASIGFRPVPQRHQRRLNAGEPGVILRTGEFVGGEIQAVRDGRVTISSIPLGLVHFDTRSEVLALIWRKPGGLDSTPCRVTTANGSVWFGTSLTIEGDWVVVKSGAIGARRLPLYEVVEMRWGRAA